MCQPWKVWRLCQSEIPAKLAKYRNGEELDKVKNLLKRINDEMMKNKLKEITFNVQGGSKEKGCSFQSLNIVEVKRNNVK